MSGQSPGSSWFRNLVLGGGFAVVMLAAVSSITGITVADEIAQEFRAGREAPNRGEAETALGHFLTVIDAMSNSQSALRGALCVAPQADQGQLVPRLLEDLNAGPFMT